MSDLEDRQNTLGAKRQELREAQAAHAEAVEARKRQEALAAVDAEIADVDKQIAKVKANSAAKPAPAPTPPPRPAAPASKPEDKE